MFWYSRSFSSSWWSSLEWNHEGGLSFTRINRAKATLPSGAGGHLLVSSFILPSSMLAGRWSPWDSWDTVELSVLTPEVATVSSLTAGACTWLWWVEWRCGSASSSMSSWSAGSLSEARLKWGLSSDHTHSAHVSISSKTGSVVCCQSSERPAGGCGEHYPALGLWWPSAQLCGWCCPTRTSSEVWCCGYAELCSPEIKEGCLSVCWSKFNASLSPHFNILRRCLLPVYSKDFDNWEYAAGCLQLRPTGGSRATSPVRITQPTLQAWKQTLQTCLDVHQTTYSSATRQI